MKHEHTGRQFTHQNSPKRKSSLHKMRQKGVLSAAEVRSMLDVTRAPQSCDTWL